ncbi:C45 family autoproteolytic acyltransferase/hydrolase [Chloroflexota bacterium]
MLLVGLILLPTACCTPSTENNPPDQPSNTAPVDSATGVILTPTLQSSGFSDSDIGDTHAASQWQITTVSADYSDPIYDSETNTTNKSSLTIQASILDIAVTYYWRVRHQDLGGNWSDWSIETSFTTIEEAAGYLYDELPTEVMPIVYLSGTEYEMGYQYGQQAGEYMEMVKDGQWASLLGYVSEAEAEAAMADLVAVIEEELTEVDLIDMFEGMADGAQDTGYDVSYDDVLICNFRGKVVKMVAEDDACSWIAAWSGATADGKTIFGGNYDFGTPTGTYPEVAIVAYPDNGNAFITHGIAGKLGDNFVMNDKGLVIGSNKGTAIRDEDVACGLSDWNLSAYIAMTCTTAAEARDVVLNATVGGGKNMLIADENGNAYAVEYTAALATVREPGDFGENNYLITTNFYLNPEMEPAQGYVGTTSQCFRYFSLEQSIGDNYGEADVNVIMDMVTAVKLNTLVSKVAVPEDDTVYLCNGSPGDGQWSSGAFGPSGEYIKIQLGDSVGSTTENVKGTAYMLLAAVEEAQATANMSSINDELELLRNEYEEGVRYYEDACSEEDTDTAYELYGKASTWFAEVQAGAQYLLDILT